MNTTVEQLDTSDVNREVGRRVHMLMWDAHMTQTTMGPMIGLQQSALSKKLKGERGWNLAELLMIGQIFGVSISYLVGESENRHPDHPNGGSCSVCAPRDLNPEPTD